jgi:hypothetical protein
MLHSPTDLETTCHAGDPPEERVDQLPARRTVSVLRCDDEIPLLVKRDTRAGRATLP